MNKSVFIQLLIFPTLLMCAMLSVSYMYWKMEENTIETRNKIPDITQLIERIQKEEGVDEAEKLLLFTKKIQDLMIGRFDFEVRSIEAYRDLIFVIISLCFMWILFVVYTYKEINRNLTKSSSGTRQKRRAP